MPGFPVSANISGPILDCATLYQGSLGGDCISSGTAGELPVLYTSGNWACSLSSFSSRILRRVKSSAGN